MSEQNPSLKCPFRATIMTRSYGCEHAEEITRREGPDIACNTASSNAQCQAFFDAIKGKALEALGHEDDLTTMPASVLQKIQYGALSGLQQRTAGDVGNDSVDNVAQLMEDAIAKFGGVDDFPFEPCIDAIKSYKMRKRRGR
ncbi:MAG: hypothetical protein PVH04_09055 [Gammaproteobacteria bacterium]|jgi:hypothetical protein